LSLEHGVLVRNIDKLKVILPLGIRYDSEVRVPLLAVLSNNEGVILIILLQEAFGVVVACNK
jgi:hypothetical protein